MAVAACSQFSGSGSGPIAQSPASSSESPCGPRLCRAAAPSGDSVDPVGHSLHSDHKNDSVCSPTESSLKVNLNGVK